MQGVDLAGLLRLRLVLPLPEDSVLPHHPLHRWGDSGAVEILEPPPRIKVVLVEALELRPVAPFLNSVWEPVVVAPRDRLVAELSKLVALDEHKLPFCYAVIIPCYMIERSCCLGFVSHNMHTILKKLGSTSSTLFYFVATWSYSDGATARRPLCWSQSRRFTERTLPFSSWNEPWY